MFLSSWRSSFWEPGLFGFLEIIKKIEHIIPSFQGWKFIFLEELKLLRYRMKNKTTTVHIIIHTEYLEDLFHLPLSVQAFQEFEAMEDICIALRASNTLDYTDTWSYIWGNDQFQLLRPIK